MKSSNFKQTQQKKLLKLSLAKAFFLFFSFLQKKIIAQPTFVSGFGCSVSVSTGFSNFLRSQMATWPS